jgi:hypothetical protein
LDFGLKNENSLAAILTRRASEVFLSSLQSKIQKSKITITGDSHMHRFAWILVLIAVAAFAQENSSDETPIGKRWWPSPWGADDQRGAANRLTPEKVLEANNLIREGKIYQLGRLYEFGMPLPGKRHFSLTIPGMPTGGPLGKMRCSQR